MQGIRYKNYLAGTLVDEEMASAIETADATPIGDIKNVAYLPVSAIETADSLLICEEEAV
jgi:hypothetical protein